MLQSALAPRSVAVIGASDNPHKVGGRPLLFLKKYGYRRLSLLTTQQGRLIEAAFVFLWF
jgi:predicted CoA-binding protein